MYVVLILSFSVYRWHGIIDFNEKLNQDKIQSKTNTCCKFYINPTKRRPLKSQSKKLGMVSKKMYQNTLIQKSWAIVGVPTMLGIL